MNTPDEEALIREMADDGEIEVPSVDSELQEPEFKEPYLPTTKTGRFLSEEGNSEFIPNAAAALNKMREYGRETVPYKDGYPDFSAFSVHDTPWGKMDSQVEIGHMTADRENPRWEYGTRPKGTGHDAAYDLGNFAQADNALSQRFVSDSRVSPEMIENYRKEQRLTWHECADGKTMILVPREIHDACKHSGGVAEQKVRMAFGDIALDDGE